MSASSVRVVARVRPLLPNESQKDVILEVSGEEKSKTIVKLPHPKVHSELYSFQFNSVYGQQSTQADLFDNEGTFISMSRNSANG
jgi:hypothetical protein